MIDPSRFDIQTEVNDGLATVLVSGELDIASLPRLQGAVDAALGERPGRLLIDLSGLTFIDSSGLRHFIQLAARAFQGSRRMAWTACLTALVYVGRAVTAAALFIWTRAHGVHAFLIGEAGEKIRAAWRGPDKIFRAATSDSLMQLQDDRWVEATEISARQYFDVAVEPRGVLWLATSEGLFRWPPAIWSSSPRVSSPATSAPSDV